MSLKDEKQRDNHLHFHQWDRSFSLSIPRIPPRTAGKIQLIVLPHRSHPTKKNLSVAFTKIAHKCQLTRAVGTPCENPVPTGCSTNRILERFVQLNSFGVGFAWPKDQLNGYTIVITWSVPSSCMVYVTNQPRTPFSWSSPSIEEQPGPPFVLQSKNRRYHQTLSREYHGEKSKGQGGWRTRISSRRDFLADREGRTRRRAVRDRIMRTLTEWVRRRNGNALSGGWRRLAKCRRMIDLRWNAAAHLASFVCVATNGD